MKKILKCLPLLLLFVMTLIVYGCDRLSTIPYKPLTTPETWLQTRPHMNISLGSLEFILMEPMSTFFVVLWGLVAIGVGFYFLRIRGKHTSRLWWGIGLILWGIGALLATPCHQAFTYQIRCAGRDFCSYTSWWSIYYMLVTCAGLNAIVIGTVHSSVEGVMKKVLPVYAGVNVALYAVICLAGAFIPNKTMVHPNTMFLFCTPGFFILFIINAIRYSKFKGRLDRSLMITWVFLGVVMVSYIPYRYLGYADKLWMQHGIWFSGPDLLHIGLILLGFYIFFAVAKKVKDLPESDT